MKTGLLNIALIICTAFTPMQKKNVGGNWIGSAKTPDGNEWPLNYTFKVDNGTLTGSTQGTKKVYQISNCKIIGDSIYFAITVDNGSQILNSGKYYSAGDTISLKLTFMGSDMYGVVKRNIVEN